MDETTKAQDESYFRIGLPFRLLVSGPSLVGKTKMVMELLRNQSKLFQEPFARVYYCIGGDLFTESHEKQALEMETCHSNLQYIVGMPNLRDIYNEPGEKFVIFDDMSDQVLSSKECYLLWQRYSHHTKTSCALILQNYYEEGKYAVPIRRTCSELILFANKGERSMLKTINHQIFSQFPNFLSNAMLFTEKHFPPHERYIFIDKSPLSPLGMNYQVRTAIIPKNDVFEPVIFVPVENK